MSAPELAACPFCGGEAEIWRANGERTAWIACMGRCSVLVSKEHKTDEEAIAAWNRRSPDLTALRAQVETLREALVAADNGMAGIAAIKPEHIGNTGFSTGPLAHFQAAQRTARSMRKVIRAALSAVSHDDTSEVSDV